MPYRSKKHTGVTAWVVNSKDQWNGWREKGPMSGDGSNNREPSSVRRFLSCYLFLHCCT